MIQEIDFIHNLGHAKGWLTHIHLTPTAFCVVLTLHFLLLEVFYLVVVNILFLSIPMVSESWGGGRESFPTAAGALNSYE